MPINTLQNSIIDSKLKRTIMFNNIYTHTHTHTHTQTHIDTEPRNLSYIKQENSKCQLP